MSNFRYNGRSVMLWAKHPGNLVRDYHEISEIPGYLEKNPVERGSSQENSRNLAKLTLGLGDMA